MCAGCRVVSTPSEVQFIEHQQVVLSKADAKKHTPDEYQKYRTAYRAATYKLIEEDEKFRWFRNYDIIREELRRILGNGNKILAKIKRIDDEKARDIEHRIASLKNSIASLKESTSTINEGRLIRRTLSKAEVLLTESELFFKKGDYDTAESKLNNVNSYALKSIDIAHSILNRYMDRNQLAKWRALVQETIAESRRRGIVVFIVSKIDQTLTVYKNGNILKTYDIGLGRNGLKDKLFAGDGGTPEGRYYIVKKNAGSRYYKALLFDYPNKEDRLRFDQAKKKGQIPRRTGIGSLLEVHGGGSGGMTKGCISLENNDMDRLYSLADVGTPLTIVGAINGTLEILSSLEDNKL
jgi:lipoprotein-anchoring transpeptidase ErfK/SrfK